MYNELPYRRFQLGIIVIVTLRAYQSQAVQDITAAFASGARAPLFVLPTGGGKTRILSHMAQSAERRGRRVLILAHRVELIDQLVSALRETDVEPHVITAGVRSRTVTQHAVAVASVQTLVRRLDDYVCPTLIIIDECHHVTHGSAWGLILKQYAAAKRLGVTATPIRLDGRGLAGHFDHLIVGPSVRELTSDGFLAPAKIYAPPTVDTSGLLVRAGEYSNEAAQALMDTQAITGDALAHYRKYADGKPALIFCTSVAHANHVAAQFNRAGIPSIDINGKTDRDVRAMAVRDFGDGKIMAMASCDIFSEGFDAPGVHCGILLRPTQSECLWRQQVGRILRPAPGKTHALILDHVNSTARFGLPDEPREWLLSADATPKKKPTLQARICAQCFAASPARSVVCVECGARFKTDARDPIPERDGELVELTAEELERKRLSMGRRQEQGRAQSLGQLIEFARAKGYAPGWAEHIWQARQAKRAKGAR